jgi:hypothetical protein
MQFYETIMGKKFFESQLPSLIKAISDLANAIKENTAVIKGGKSE